MTNPSTESTPSFWSDLRRAWDIRRREWQHHQRLKRARRPLGVPPGTRQSRLENVQEALEPGADALRVWGILLSLSAVALGLGVEFGDRFGLVLGFIVTLALNLWCLVFSPGQILNRYTAWHLEGRDAWGLITYAREAAARASLATPIISLADSDELFCFSIGVSPSRSRIVISHALVEKLSPEERRLLISFETAKIACHWTASATVARGLCRLIDGPALGRLAYLLLRLSLGKGRIFKLDEWVASHGQSREVWARTLWSLDAMVGSKPRRSKPSDSALDTVSFLTGFQSARYDRTLPTVQSRIAALIDRYPP